MPEKERTEIKFILHDAGAKTTVQVSIRKERIMRSGGPKFTAID
jgi:hypothetical protein